MPQQHREPDQLVQAAATEAQDTFMEPGDQASAVKVMAQHLATTATETDTQAFGPTPAYRDSATATATAPGWEEDMDTSQVLEDMANFSPPATVDMARATTLALAPLVVAMELVHLVSEQAAVRRR